MILFAFAKTPTETEPAWPGTPLRTWRWACNPGFGRRVSYEPVSAAGYYQDGSMRCPFEDIRGETPCGWHTYSGCSDDFEAPAVAQ